MSCDTYRRFLVSAPGVARILSKDDRVIVDHVSGSGVSAEAYVRESQVEEVKDIFTQVRWVERNDSCRPAVRYEKLKKKNKKRDATSDKWAKYTHHEEMRTVLQTLQRRFPRQCRLFSVGTSVQGRELWTVEIFHDLQQRHKQAVPCVKLVANMHGNETVGRQMLIRLAHWLCEKFAEEEDPESTVKQIMRNVRIFLMPSMNPDGFEAGSRFNANGEDLNRNFPDTFRTDEDFDGSEPETVAVQRWTRENGRFVVSANMHGGALVASYPYDNSNSHSIFNTTPYSPTPQDATIRWISEEYASINAEMVTKGGFPKGVTNGADWYHLVGGMQDWNYAWHGIMSLTLELSMTKYPSPEELPKFWESNRDAMLFLLSLPTKSIRGKLIDTDGNPVFGAVVRVKDNPKLTLSLKPFGDFYRLVEPGTTVNFEIEAPGFLPFEVQAKAAQDLGEIVLQPRETPDPLVPQEQQDKNVCLLSFQTALVVVLGAMVTCLLL